MKDIKDMNLAEVAGEISLIAYGHPLEELMPYMSRIYELHKEHEALKEQTRWISVLERLPTETDGDGNGYVEFWNTKYQTSNYYKYDFLPERYGLEITHWKRITPPEEP